MNWGDIVFRALIKVDPAEIKRAAQEAGAELDRSGLDHKAKSIGDTLKKDVSGGFHEAGAAASRFGDVGRGAVMGIGMGLAQAGIGLAMDAIKGALDSVGKAMDMAETKADRVHAANVIFGASYAQVAAAADGAAKSVGMSSSAYTGAANDLGALLNNMGFAQDESAGMSTGMLQLAADIGTFRSKDPSDVLAAIQKGLAGSTRGLKEYGIVIGTADVAQEAMRLGLIGSVDELSKMDAATQKNVTAQATWSLILKQSAGAQGEFAAQSHDLGAQQQIMAARMEDAMTRIGAKLLPLAETIMPMLADAVVGLVDGITAVVDAITDWVDHNQPLIHQIQDLAKWLGDNLGPIFKILMDVVGELGYRLGGLIGIIVDTLGVIVDLSGAMAAVLRGDWDTAVQHAELAGGRLVALQADLQRVAGDGQRRALDQQASYLLESELQMESSYRTQNEANANMYAEFAHTTAAGLGELAGLPGENPIVIPPPDTAPVIKAIEKIKVTLGDLTGALGDMVKSSNDEWRAWKDAPQESAADIEKRIDKLNRRLVKLNEVDLQTLGPSALAAWAAAKDATQTELGQLTGFVDKRSDIVAYAFPKALNASQSDWVDAWGALTGLTKDEVDALKRKLGIWAGNAADAWLDNFTTEIRSGRGDIRDALRVATKGMVAVSPPPDLPDIGLWGFRTALAWGDGFVAAADQIADRAQATMGRIGRAIRAGMPDLAGAVGDAAGLTGGIVSGAQPRLTPAYATGWPTAAEQIMARAQFPDFAPAHGARAIAASVGSLGEMSTGPIRHEYSGTVTHRLEIPASTARALRNAGYSIQDVASLMRTVGEELGYQSTRFSEAPRY